MAAHIGITIKRRHEFIILHKSLRARLGRLWWIPLWAFMYVINGTFEDWENVAHHGGTVGGLLMTLTLLNLQGVPRLMVLALWILSTTVWIRISSKMDQPELPHIPNRNEINDTLLNNFTACVSRCLPEDEY